MTGLGGLDNVALDLEDIQDILDAGNNSRMFLGNGVCVVVDIL